MSYARFGWEGSDVYVFLSVSGWLECCACQLRDDFGGFHAKTTDEFLAHLDEHEKAGHTVPPSCREELIGDREENEHWIKTGEWIGDEEE